MDLSWLLSPLDQNAYVQEHWAKKPLKIQREDTAYYESLLPESDLEFALLTASKVLGAVEILGEGDHPVPAQSHEQAIAEFRQGKSLRIDAIQRFSLQVATLCQSLEQVIHCRVSVNMYLTPGAGRKALDRHYDTHDVFVLQIHGNKMWRLYDHRFTFPLEFLPLQRGESIRELRKFRLKEDFSGRANCNLTDGFTLKAGDLLYVPRGFWHEAESEAGKVSCHLTVGIQPTTYLEVLSVALSNVALSDPRLRESLPFGFATDPAAGSIVGARIQEVLKDLPGRADAKGALNEVISRFRRICKIRTENHLLQLVEGYSCAEVNEESRVCTQDGVVAEVNDAIVPPRMLFGSQAFEITPGYEDACRFIAQTPEFTPVDLPGQLTLPQKIALVRQLVGEKLLILAKEGAVVGQPQTKSFWFPTRVDVGSKSVTWIDLGLRPLEEPFFQQTVSRFKQEHPAAGTRITSFQKLESQEEEILLSGLIFHISRCGSTLLANGLKAFQDTVVISEPQAISDVLVSGPREGWKDRSGKGNQFEERDDLLRNLIRAYGQRRTGSEKALVIKCSSWNILHLATFRRLWPQVPCVVLVRDPTEIAVSCLEDLPGWMRWRDNRKIIRSMFGWKEELSELSETSFCARVIGEFLNRAANAADNGCQLIDYTDLGASRIEGIARQFGLEVTPGGLEAMQSSLSIYSKDPRGKRPFFGDRGVKQQKVSDTIREEVQRWTEDAYMRTLLEAKTI